MLVGWFVFLLVQDYYITLILTCQPRLATWLGWIGIVPGNHWIIVERVCYTGGSAFVFRKDVPVNDTDVVAALVAKLEPFETLVVDGGRIWGQRAYKETTLADCQQRIAACWTPQHRLEVTRFVDGYKLTVLRSLLT